MVAIVAEQAPFPCTDQKRKPERKRAHEETTVRKRMREPRNLPFLETRPGSYRGNAG